MRWMAMYSFWTAVVLSLIQAGIAFQAAGADTAAGAGSQAPTSDLFGIIGFFLSAAFGGKVLQKGLPAGGISKLERGTGIPPDKERRAHGVEQSEGAA